MRIHWHWYVARDNELLLDCDSHTCMQICLKRLEEGRIPYERIEAKKIFVTRSNREGHFHVAIQLRYPLPLLNRMVWQLHLYDDTTRSTMNLFRALHGVPAPCLLISPQNWSSAVALNRTKFWRNADAVCFCDPMMHKKTLLINDCPAHKKLRSPQEYKKEEQRNGKMDESTTREIQSNDESQA